MTIKRIVGLIALALAATLLPAFAESAPEKALTVMIYMCGSSLESSNGSGTKDIDEILDSGVDAEAVNVLLMTGGSRTWQTGQDAGTIEIQAIRYSDRSGKNIWANADRIPTRSMGDAETLSYFLNYAVANHPAREYALILWNHGGGPMEGLCLDELYDPDLMTIEELTDALRQSPFATRKLAWIGFDACLMGSMEVALQMAPYARYMISSEETEPVDGWDYSFLSDIAGDADGAATGRRILDAYISEKAEGPMTLSCIDLGSVEGLRQSVDRLFLNWQGRVDEKTYSAIARQRKSIAGYGMDVGRDMRDHDLIDLAHLVSTLSEDRAELGDSVLDAVADAVVCEVSNLKDSCGLTVYFPFYNKESYEKKWKEAYADIGLGESYGRFIDRFGEILTGAPLADWRQLSLALFVGERKQTAPESALHIISFTNLDAAADINDAEIITAEDQALAGEGILAKAVLDPAQQEAFASARLLVLERFHTMYTQQSQYRVLYTSPALDMDADGAVRALYGEQTLHVLDASGQTLASEISYSTLDNGEYAVEVKARSDYSGYGAEEIPMIMTFRASEDGSFERTGIYVYDSLKGAYDRRTAYDAEKYPYLAFPGRYITVQETPEGGMEWRDSESYARESVVRYTDDWRLAFRTASSMSEMTVCMEITDTQNNRHITAMRTVGRGYLSPDLLSDCPFLRVLAEDMQVGADRIDLSLTLIASEGQALEIYAFDPRINGERVDFMTSDGASGYTLLQVDADSSVKRVLSFPAANGDTLEELSLRFALRYDPTQYAGANQMENGLLVIDGWGDDQNDAGGERWEYTQRIRLAMRAPVSLPGEGQVVSPSALSICAGALYSDSSYRGLVLDSAAPIGSRLDGGPMLRRAALPIPEEARGFDTALLLSGTLNDGYFEIAGYAPMESTEDERISFVLPCARVSLAAGEEALPLAIGTGYPPDGVLTYTMAEIRLLSEADEGEHQLLQGFFDDRSLTHVEWLDAAWPVELADHVQTVSVGADLTVGAPFQMLQQPVTVPVSRLPLSLRFDDAGQMDRRVVYLDENGCIMAVQAVEDTDLGEAVSRSESAMTEVYHQPFGVDGYYPEYQFGDWIAWSIGDGDELRIVRYVGAQTDVTVPDELGGMAVTGIWEGAFDCAHVRNIALPSGLTQLSENPFEEQPTREMWSLRDTVTYDGPMSELPLTPMDIHESWKFRRLRFGDGETLWSPPLVYSRLETGGWSVAGCNACYEDVRIPSQVDGAQVVSIAPEAFVRSSTAYIRSVDISEGIESVGGRAFAGSSLTEITLPASLRQISADAFEDCGMLGRVVIHCDPDVLPDGIFDTCPLLHDDPSAIVLPAQASDAQVKRLSEALGLTGDARLAREGEAPLAAAQPGDVSRFFGKWVVKSSFIAGQEWVVVGSEITLYEDGVYNGLYFNMPIEGRWIARGNAIQTEDALLFLQDDTHMTFYSNQFRGLFEKEG